MRYDSVTVMFTDFVGFSAFARTLTAEALVEQIDFYFRAFDDILVHQAQSRPVPSEFGVDGYYFRFQRHIVYWRRLSGGDVGIVTILHERMHQIDRFREDECP